MNAKKVLLIETRGGVYSEGPAAEMEYSQKYLKQVINFLGIQNFDSLIAEGLAIDPARAEAIFEEKVLQAEQMAKLF